MSDNSRVIHGRQKKTEHVHPDYPAGTSTDTAWVVVLAGLAAAWIAAGSTGLLGHSLRRMLTLAALAIAVLAQRSFAAKPRPNLLILLAAIGAGICMVTSPLAPVNLTGVAVVVASLAIASRGQSKRMLLVCAVATVAFAIYRQACTSIPLVWLTSDSLGRTIGSMAGLLTKQPVNVGATFAGVDFLLLTGAMWLLWLASSPSPRWMRGIYGFAAIVGGHLGYLMALSFVPVLLAAVPKPAAPGPWSWAGFLHKAVPWNVPLLACGIHLLILGTMFRWSTWVSNKQGNDDKMRRHSAGLARAVWVLAPGMAILLGLVTALYPGKLTLQGKKIVFYEKGFLNWLKPGHGQYGRLSSGMYGMLPVYLESLGGTSIISAGLSDEDLKNADVLVLIFPDESWVDGQLNRIWDFVRRGGSLLLMGEHTTGDSNGDNRFNEILKPTAMQVQFDSATFAVGGWLQSYESIAHPMTAGVRDDQNQFGVVIGASMLAGWPAHPLLIGRWGWSDPGDEGSSRAMMGNGQYDAGERLGDLVLVAEQRLGKGRIVAFGDTSNLTNGINFSCHPFNARLFGYLASRLADPHAIWRQILGVLVGAFLVGLLVWHADAWTVISTGVGLAGSIVIATAVTCQAGQLLPDGRYKSPNNLAYIDSSHLEAYSGESWRPSGIGGLALTLMRNEYLALSLPELAAERLQGASLLISVAPSREYSRAERATIKNFVASGGNLIVTVGQERAGPSRSLLSEFAFALGAGPDQALETEAMGHFKSPYLRSQDERAHVRFHAAWPITCTDPMAEVIAYGRDNRPVIILRRFGSGKIVVIGDTCFATNMNLEWEGGEPFEGMRENADFWRWFITRLRDEPMWVPPALRSAGEPNEAKAAPSKLK